MRVVCKILSNLGGFDSLTFDISSTVTLSEHRKFFILYRCRSSSLKLNAALFSPDPVLVLKSPLLLQGRSNAGCCVQLPNMLVLSDKCC